MLHLGLGLGLGPGNGIIFSLCKVTKTFVLLLACSQYDVHDVSRTVCDVMMMYSKEWYMENLPSCVTGHYHV